MTVTLGLDTSHYQGAYDYAAAHAKGARFAGVQLTVGVTDDAHGVQNVQRAHVAGLLVMPYHFATNSANGADQADFFHATLGSNLPTWTYPILDIEPKEGATKTHIVTFLDRWFGQDYGRLGVYSGPGAFARVMGRNFDLAKLFPQITLRWNADYRGPLVTSADDPRFDLFYNAGQFGYGGWTSAQFVQDGSRFGTDGDVFAGSETDLATLFAGPQPPKAVITLRYGASPAHGQHWQAITHAPVFAGPGVGSKHITAHAPGSTFSVYQTLKRANGNLWLGSADGTRWTRADGKVKKE